LTKLKPPTQKAPEHLTVLDITNAQQAAQHALQSGDVEKALQTVNQAKEIIRSLSQTGNASKAYLTETSQNHRRDCRRNSTGRDYVTRKKHY